MNNARAMRREFFLWWAVGYFLAPICVTAIIFLVAYANQIDEFFLQFLNWLYS